MEDDKWDNENFRTQHKTSPIGFRTNQWEGEDDEEDEIKVSWDELDDDQDDKKDEKKEEPVPRAVEVKKPKKLLSKIEEKERKQQEAIEKKLQMNDEVKSPEEILADKLRQQKLQEEADLEVAKHLLGVKSDLPELETKEDFDKYIDEIIRQIGSATKNQNFPDFVEQLVQQLCVHLSATDLKRIHTWIGNLQIEKNKMEQGAKSKKKGKGKAKLNIDNASDIYSNYTDDLYDDFM